MTRTGPDPGFKSGAGFRWKTLWQERRVGFARHRPYIWPVVLCLELRHGLSSARPREPDDGYLRETFTLPRDKARARARDFLDRYPKAAYMSSVESWRELPDGDIEFTMRRLASAD